MLFVLKVAVKDALTGHVIVDHPLRRAYLTAVSVLLFLAPLCLMAVTYSLVMTTSSSTSSQDP